MSADTEVANLLSYATTAASSLASQSSDLVNSAVEALEKTVEFPLWNPNPEDQGRTPPGLPPWVFPVEPPITFPAWPQIDLAEPPVTQELAEIDIVVDAQFPNLSLPSFNGYPPFSEIAPFDKTPPTIDSTVTTPDAPDTDVPFSPTLILPRSVQSLPSVEITPPELLPVTTDLTGIADNISGIYQRALSQFRGRIEGDIEPLLVDARSWSDDLLTGVQPAVLAAFSSRMTTPSASVLAQQAHTALSERLNERLFAERDRVAAIVATDRSGWDLPAAVRMAMTDNIEQFRQAKFQAVQSGFYTKTVELALAIFEVYEGLLARISMGYAELHEKAISLVFDTHQQSLAAAKKTVDSLLKVHDTVYVKIQKLAMDVVETKLVVVEQQLTAAMAAFDLAKINLEIEEAKQDADAISVAILRADVRKAENEAKYFATKVSAIRSELESFGLSGELFALKVRAFSARIDAHQAQVACRVAEIEGDEDKLKGKLVAVKEYEAKVAAFEKIIAANSRISTIQAERNDAIMEEFSIRATGALAPLKQQALADQYTLRKYETQANTVIADARISEKLARAQLKFLEAEQGAMREAFRFSQERTIDILNAELKRVESIATANEMGAGIMANMATSAMSVANGIAHTIISESA